MTVVALRAVLWIICDSSACLLAMTTSSYSASSLPIARVKGALVSPWLGSTPKEANFSGKRIFGSFSGIISAY